MAFRVVQAIQTELSVARQADQISFISLDPVSPSCFDDVGWRDHNLPLRIDREQREVPRVPSRVEMWKGDDDTEWPHLRYTCPVCNQPQNVDLFATDPSPRFACCDQCGWASVCWLEWRLPCGWRPYKAIVWDDVPEAIGQRCTVFAPSLQAAKQWIVAQFGSRAAYTLHNEDDANAPRS